MKKSMIASAVAIGLGAVSTANALTVSITQIRGPSNNSFIATGSINSNGTGTFNSIEPFLGIHWTADAVSYFGTTGAHTWTDNNDPTNNTNDSIPIDNFAYNFSLTANQVAWGTYFDWNANYDIPILNIMTCSGFTPGDACTGTGTPMQTLPFLGNAVAFDGVVTNASSPVPIPAAAWLLGSGLVGLAGIVRRKKKQNTRV